MTGLVWCLMVIFVVLMVSFGAMIVGSVLMNIWFNLREKEKKADAERALKTLGSLKSTLGDVKKSNEDD